ncbi:MAG TPA: hypothetical protein VFE51_06180 [Verrucomicrobiae bacterium]|nr:hypothetical protein [Verrucomicrobiae bacterium]
MKANPKSEDRRPKAEKTPQFRPTKRLDGGVVRVSGFGFVSAFGLRTSDFRRGRAAGYLLTEALVYIGLVFLLLGIGSAALYRCIDNSVALRRNADDILRVVHAGELWRADVRGAKGGIAWDKSAAQPVLRLREPRGEVDYRYDGTNVLRRIGNGPWSRILDRVKVSAMSQETRSTITAWRWELELQPITRGSFKTGRVRPLFTFLAASPAAAQP